MSFIEMVYNDPIRLLELESSALAKKAEESLVRKREELTPYIRELEKKKFVCLAEAVEQNTYTFAWPGAETRTRVPSLLLLMEVNLEGLLQ